MVAGCYGNNKSLGNKAKSNLIQVTESQAKYRQALAVNGCCAKEEEDEENIA